ncbi:M23 family peptidase [Chryseobacterium indologenes]|uniref:peptidoglycan DD-metalloendopeptidase family protein n=1 Tax=Chryseobacterium TaxID=59732 RepID=UPI000483AAB7|nr:MULTISPECIES: peptidoglycan DD-metalloendopeptidase family protein [Chryseobacterium]ASE64005.1 peptidase M23 [Chryseobacterium indologenes]ATN04086.1 peptidase M23 [Chryseobacterium indologenes]AYY83250.1 M23 family peptidase [Chryseobacterium indologenes]AYZ37079.1 M23 family peptidase [Chryseobacterium indologenes]MEB4760968.1 peptidoglycan DD-metalloendopeptidase family protein [Chryseobacterium indologenes]
MKKFLNSKKNVNILLGGLLLVVFGQGIFIAKLFSEKDDKNYEVNLVKINTEKDSVDYLKMKTDLTLVDQTVGQLNSFLRSKDISNEKLMMLDQDSISNSIYLSKQANRYSQYLMDLQKKLMEVPLGMPTDGYISSNFGVRKNPIPFKTVYASVKSHSTSTAAVAAPQPEVKAEPVEKIVELTDSYGNKREVKVMVTPKAAPVASAPTAPTTAQTVATNASKAGPAEKNNPPAEADQMQFHKGLDIAVAFGSDVRAAAAGTVIFSGQKGGYGNCVIVSHGNGLATLYGHLSQLVSKVNDKVKVGQVIAKSGNSGRSTGPHLHYEVHKNNTPVNPKLFMNL